MYLEAAVALEGKAGTLALQDLGGDQALYLGGLAVLLAVLWCVSERRRNVNIERTNHIMAHRKGMAGSEPRKWSGLEGGRERGKCSSLRSELHAS